jgi:hypothetical protein
MTCIHKWLKKPVFLTDERFVAQILIQRAVGVLERHLLPLPLLRASSWLLWLLLRLLRLLLLQLPQPAVAAQTAIFNHVAQSTVQMPASVPAAWEIVRGRERRAARVCRQQRHQTVHRVRRRNLRKTHHFLSALPTFVPILSLQNDACLA